MKYVPITPNPSGAYPAPQSAAAPGLLELTDEQAAVVIRYNGFVTITTVDDSVTVTPNMEAWEAWKQSEADKPLPEAEPTPQEDADALTINHEYRLTLLELGVN